MAHPIFQFFVVTALMRLFRVTVPEDRAAEVYQLLHKEHKIPHIARMHADNLFVLDFRIRNECSNQLLGALQKAGVGRQFGYIDILPIETSIPMTRIETNAKKKSFFRRSYGVSERVTVEAIYAGVSQNNNISFDFLTLLTVAAMIAGVGLATNSVVSVVASMLVSPLMGPILAFSLGALINDRKMFVKGLINEAIALSICVCIGFLLGFVFLAFGPFLEWPTAEMSGRGVPVNLLYGAMVASPSGVGVALSLTSSNVSSLIGVAISASLLPPAVNAGMSLNYALFGPLVHGSEVSRTAMLVISGTSFSLSIVNIICINIFAMSWFKLKKIAPITSVDTDIFKGFSDIDQHPALFGDFYNPYDEDQKIEAIMDELEENSL